MLAGKRVEGLCTCDCHEFADFKSTYNFSPITGSVIGGERYDQASLISKQLDEDADLTDANHGQNTGRSDNGSSDST